MVVLVEFPFKSKIRIHFFRDYWLMSSHKAAPIELNWIEVAQTIPRLFIDLFKLEIPFRGPNFQGFGEFLPNGESGVDDTPKALPRSK